MNRDRTSLYLASFFRSVGIGLVGVLFSLYLAERKIQPAGMGLILGAGLAANALLTFWISVCADRFGRKKTLLLVNFCSAAGAFAFSFSSHYPLLLLFSFLGILNAMGRDRGASASLEQAILPSTATHERRTWVFAFYNLILDGGSALGGLLAVFPALMRNHFGCSRLVSYQAGFWLYAGLMILCFISYFCLSEEVEFKDLPKDHGEILPDASKKIVYKLAGLFALDSLGSGFLSNALISYWFFLRFGVREEVIGPIFFFGHLANSLSHLAAAWLAKRLGSINSMVFTHIPSSFLLMIVPLSPSLPLAVGFYILRECLVEMDVPVRQSYVMAVVPEKARTFASGITGLTKMIAWALSPPLAGLCMKVISVSSPLFLGPAIKIIYDLLLFKFFRKVKPPEEVK